MFHTFILFIFSNLSKIAKFYIQKQQYIWQFEYILKKFQWQYSHSNFGTPHKIMHYNV